MAFGVFGQPARAQAPTPEQAAAQALELFNGRKYKEAVDAYEKVIKDYPTSLVVSEAQFRVGYLRFLLGEFDQSVTVLQKLVAPPAPVEIQELAASIIPKAIAAKASAMPEGDAKRTATFEQAIKAFDDFLKKYPKSDDVESVVYSKAIALYQMSRFDEAATALRGNLAAFPKSESVQDSKYMLALVLATEAAMLSHGEKVDPAGAAAKFDESEKLLREIVAGTDVAQANSARFQLGEVLFNRAVSTPKDQRGPIWDKAADAYRAVRPREEMKKAQEARLNDILARIRQAGQARDVAGMKRLQRLQEREQGKLEEIANKADQTVTSIIKTGIIFFLKEAFDESRVLLNHMERFADDKDQQRDILYYRTLTYGSQGLADKAETSYEAFKSKFKGNPVGENLPAVVGGAFLSPKVNRPEKAIAILREGLETYPKGTYTPETSTQLASALLMLKRYDEALKAFQNFVATKPRADLSAAAELGIANIYAQTGKLDPAIEAFKKVRDTYAGTPQAEQSAFNVGGLYVQKSDFKSAIGELTAFLEKFPASESAAAARFYLGISQELSGDRASAVATYRAVVEKPPGTPQAGDSLLRIANLQVGEQKFDEMAKTLREFLEKYPESDKVFDAYSLMGQVNVSSGKVAEALAGYREFVEKRANDPKVPMALLQIGELSRKFADAMGRYLVLNEDQRAEWQQRLDGSLEASTRVIQDFPGSEQVPFALQSILAVQRMLVQAQVKTADQVETYFDELAGKMGAGTEAEGRIRFAAAVYVSERDKERALEKMRAAFNPELKYTATDIDLFGSALFAAGKADEAMALYTKLAADYPPPQGATPEQMQPQVADAQAVALYGTGKALQEQGKSAEAAAKFDELKTKYPWSPKILEASLGIAQSKFNESKFDEAQALLIPIIRAQNANADLRARSFLLQGRVQESKGNVEAAIDSFLKISAFFAGVRTVAAEGLWRGGQMLEKQAGSAADPKVKSAQIAKAVKAYTDLTKNYADSEFAPRAQERLSALPAPGK
jgi:TolA-binding protein